MRVEFFGVARQLAGSSELEVPAETLGMLLGKLAQHSSLARLIEIDRLQSSFVANLNGDRFISDPNTPLAPQDHILILSADAGG